VQWRSVDSLQSLLTCSGHLGSTLYYRVLDMPLADWESMKTVKVRAGSTVKVPHQEQYGAI